MKYFKLWLSFFKNSLIRQLDYKTNFIGRLITEVFWVGTQIIFFKAIFLQVDSFAGWREGEIYLFVASLYIVDGLHVTLMSDNQNKFGGLIRMGMFDFYLLRPVSSFFMSSFRFVNFPGLVNLSAAVLLFSYTLGNNLVSVSPSSLALLFAHLMAGLGLLFCLSTCSSAIAFWATQVQNLNWLFYELYRLGWRPENIYPNWIKRMLLTVFPAAFFVSIPTQIALGKLSGIWWTLAPFAFVTVVALLASILWKKGLRKYEGALS